MRWYKEDLMREAKKYDSLRLFRRKNVNAYQSAQRQGFLKEMTWLKRRRRKTLTKDIVLDIAKGFKTKQDFETNDPSAYICACRNGWLGEMTWMKTRKRINHLTDEQLLSMTKEYVYMRDFRNENGSAYNLLCQRGLIKDVKLKRLKKMNKLGEYSYEKKNKCYYIYKVTSIENGVITKDKVYEEGYFFDKEDAKKRVYELNGWNLKK